MLEEKIMNWLDNKYDSSPYVDYETIAKKMMELAEGEDFKNLNFKYLHDEAIEILNDDGNIYPNDRDYDAEDEDGI